MAQDERKIEASDEQDRQAVYVSRAEASPLTNPAPSRREKLHGMIYDRSVKFPGERRLQIMPDLNRILPGGHKKNRALPEPQDPLIETQKQRNARLDKEVFRRMDLFKVFHPLKMPPTSRRLF